MKDRLQIETGEAGYAIRDNVAGEVLAIGEKLRSGQLERSR